MDTGQEQSQVKPLVIAFVADLFFAVKIEHAIQALDYRVQWIERADQVAAEDLDAPERQLAEHLSGQGAALVELLTRVLPALVIFDLSNAEVPWRHWIALIKSAPATRRIPVICYGSHVDSGTMTAAREAGADAVLARSQFSSALPELVQKYARVYDVPGLDVACNEQLSPLAQRGLEEFNRGEYFEAHETLEHAWNADQSPSKELYRAILQVAVAYLQIERGNYRGAVKMFLRMRQWFAPLPDHCRGVDVSRLRQDAQRVYEALIEKGPEDIAAFDRSLFKAVQYESGPAEEGSG